MEGRKISVVVTVKNEAVSIGALLEALYSQTQKPEEIVIVDAGSTDRTVELINTPKAKIIIRPGVSRAEGRNIGVKLAKGSIIAMTDAGCIPHKEWLRRIAKPFEDPMVDIAAGFYTMAAKTPFQKSASVFLGVLPQDFSDHFLPSARSMAFRKEIWKKIGGFPQNLESTAEDTIFNYKAIKRGARFVRVKKAVVEWGIPGSFLEVVAKIYQYARGDAQSKIFWNPGQGIASHNIKAILILARYLIGFSLLVLSLQFPHLQPAVLILIFLYAFWAFAKAYSKTKNWRSGLWGIPLQISSDLAVMAGFLAGVYLIPDR